jgi:hypothetical protein
MQAYSGNIADFEGNVRNFRAKLFISGGGSIPLAPGFRRFAPVIRGQTLSWVRPGHGRSKIHPSVGRTREPLLISEEICFGNSQERETKLTLECCFCLSR